MNCKTNFRASYWFQQLLMLHNLSIEEVHEITGSCQNQIHLWIGSESSIPLLDLYKTYSYLKAKNKAIPLELDVFFTDKIHQNKYYIYKNEFVAVIDVSKLTGLSWNTVSNRISAAGLYKTVGADITAIIDKPLGHKDHLRRYLFKGSSLYIAEIEKIIGKTSHHIRSRIVAAGLLHNSDVDTASVIEAPTFCRYEIEFYWYRGERLSLQQLKEKYRIGVKKFRAILRENGILHTKGDIDITPYLDDSGCYIFKGSLMTLAEITTRTHLDESKILAAIESNEEIKNGDDVTSVIESLKSLKSARKFIFKGISRTVQQIATELNCTTSNVNNIVKINHYIPGDDITPAIEARKKRLFGFEGEQLTINQISEKSGVLRIAISKAIEKHSRKIGDDITDITNSLKPPIRRKKVRYTEDEIRRNVLSSNSIISLRTIEKLVDNHQVELGNAFKKGVYLFNGEHLNCAEISQRVGVLAARVQNKIRLHSKEALDDVTAIVGYECWEKKTDKRYFYDGHLITVPQIVHISGKTFNSIYVALNLPWKPKIAEGTDITDIVNSL